MRPELAWRVGAVFDAQAQVNVGAVGVCEADSRGWDGFGWLDLDDFGTVESAGVRTSTVPGSPSFADKGGRQTIETVRAGVSYKFTP